MSFFLYNLTVFLSLPKTIIFVALGNPNNSGKHGVTIAKVIAFGVVAIVTCECREKAVSFLICTSLGC